MALLSEQYRGQQERLDRRAAMAALLQIYHPGLRKGEVGDPFTLDELVALLGHGFQRRAPALPASAPLPPEELAERLTLLAGFYAETSNGQG